MKFAEILKKYGALCEIRARDKPTILREISQTLAHRTHSLEGPDVERILLEREKVESTALGFGVALPHGKSARIDEPICLFARSREGVDFGALDGEPTHFFFAMLTPAKDNGSHLSLLAEVSRVLTSQELRESLMSVPTEDPSRESAVEKKSPPTWATKRQGDKGGRT